MGKIFKKIKNTINGAVKSVKAKFYSLSVKIRIITAQARVVFAENRAENFVDSGVKILIAVVIGALLLGGLYALFGDTIMPTVTDKVEDMFNFKG